MYGGHFGFALAARTGDRDLVLAVAVPAAFAPDLLRIGWTAAGGSASVGDGFATSLMTSVGLALLLGAAWGWHRASVGSGVVMGLLVASHAVGDLVEGAVDLWPRGPSVGLNLSRVALANHGLQLAIIGVGWYLYRRTLDEPTRNSGRWKERSSVASWAASGILVSVLGFHLAAVVVRAMLAN